MTIFPDEALEACRAGCIAAILRPETARFLNRELFRKISLKNRDSRDLSRLLAQPSKEHLAVAEGDGLLWCYPWLTGFGSLDKQVSLFVQTACAIKHCWSSPYLRSCLLSLT